jgi:hypothetical protein
MTYSVRKHDDVLCAHALGERRVVHVWQQALAVVDHPLVMGHGAQSVASLQAQPLTDFYEDLMGRDADASDI